MARPMFEASDSVRPWLSMVGIGEDGVEGLSPAARALVSSAELVVGGARHLALAASLIQGEQHAWPTPLSAGLDAVLAARGRAVVVLASGDPYDYGIGVQISARVPLAEMRCVPAPSSISLACARLGWARQETTVVSLCGRPLARLAPHLQPGRRLLILSADETTPALVAGYVTARGFGASWVHLLEALGGPDEAVSAHIADRFDAAANRLNLLGLDIVAEPGARVIPLAPGLDDAGFEHDGQITKREIRALTLSALAPRAGERLWDLGCGSGSIAIEWLLRHPANTAVGVEQDPERCARAARNAIEFGVPDLELVQARAPDGLAGLPAPEAIFIGGGARAPGLIPTAWAALKPGGRMVANSVTLESDAVLFAARQTYGGALTRLSVERLDTVGGLHAFRPALTVTQWSAVKP
ncbi:MAG: precorrin-6y C5,15-methyltransferase (decarboxylating) subunit CbiE [Caulobacteraceae bacterium]